MSSVCKGNVSFLTIFNVNVNESMKKLLMDFKNFYFTKLSPIFILFRNFVNYFRMFLLYRNKIFYNQQIQ